MSRKAEVINKIRELAAYYPDIDANIVNGIISHESNYNPRAVGDNGRSWGLGQFIDNTRQTFAVALDLNPNDREDWFNIHNGVKAIYHYLRWINSYLDKKGYEKSLYNVLMCYGAGCGNLGKEFPAIRNYAEYVSRFLTPV